MAGLELSYVYGASDRPLIGKTVGQLFDEASAKWPSRPALIVRQQNVRLTYAELRQAVDKLAAGLLTLGLNPGDRIGIWSPNNSEWVLTQFATAKAGLILVNISPPTALPSGAGSPQRSRRPSRGERSSGKRGSSLTSQRSASYP